MADNGKPPQGKALDEIAKQLEQQQLDSLPPVDSWNPDFTGDIDIRIDREGHWYHEDSVFKRDKLVKLFASILKKEGEEYFLVTPVEKFRITVDDLPFSVTALEEIHTREGTALKLTTNLGDEVVAGKEHPLVVETDADSGEPRPSIRVRKNLHARIHRNVFYELVAMAQEVDSDHGKVLQVTSGRERFELGRY